MLSDTARLLDYERNVGLSQDGLYQFALSWTSISSEHLVCLRNGVNRARVGGAWNELSHFEHVL